MPEGYTSPRSDQPVNRFNTRDDRVQIVERPESHRVTRLARRATDVRQQKRVFQFPVARVDVWLVVEDIEPCGKKFA